MKKILFATLFCLMATIVKAQYYKGYYVSSTGERVEGFISLETYEDHLFYKPIDTVSRKKVNIDDIKMVVVNTEKHSDTLVVKIDSESVDDHSKYFAMLYADSPVKLYKKFKKDRTFGAPGMPGGMPGGAAMMVAGGVTLGLTFKTSGEFDTMVDLGNVTTRVTRKTYKPIMARVTQEFPGLAKQTQDGTYGYSDIETVVAVYKKLKERKAEGKSTDY